MAASTIVRNVFSTGLDFYEDAGFCVMTTGPMSSARPQVFRPEPPAQPADPPVVFGRRAIAMSGKIGDEP